MVTDQFNQRLCIIFFYVTLDFDECAQVVDEVSVVNMFGVETMLLI